MSHFQNFIFDLDGTLVNSGDLIVQAFSYALSPWGKTITQNEIEIIRPRKTEQLMDGFVHTDEDKKLALDRLIEFSSKHLHLNMVFDGIEQFLSQAVLANRSCFVWTGRDTESAIEIVKLKEIEHFFKEIVGNTTIEHNKPHPDGILYILKKYNLDPSKTIMIGDHEHDIRGAKAAHVTSGFAHWGAAFVPDLKTLAPHYDFSSTKELMALL